MLFGVVYKGRSGVTEEMEKRGLQLFSNWTPPFEFKAHYSRADNGGGIAIVESDSAEAIIEGIAPWLPYLEFELTPVADVQAAVPVVLRAYAWRYSVS